MTCLHVAVSDLSGTDVSDWGHTKPREAMLYLSCVLVHLMGKTCAERITQVPERECNAKPVIRGCAQRRRPWSPMQDEKDGGSDLWPAQHDGDFQGRRCYFTVTDSHCVVRYDQTAK